MICGNCIIVPAAQTGSNDDIKQRMIDDVKVIVYDLFWSYIRKYININQEYFGHHR